MWVVCEMCGAVVAESELHEAWHTSQEEAH